MTIAGAMMSSNAAAMATMLFALMVVAAVCSHPL
jgi:hypothetical protein